MADTNGWASVEEPTKVCQRTRGGGRPSRASARYQQRLKRGGRSDVSPGGCSALASAAQQCRQGRLFLSAHLTVLTVWSPRSTLLEDGGPGPQKASCSPGSRPLQGAMPFPGTSKNTPHTSARPGPAFTCPPLGQGPRLPSCRTRRSGPNLSKTPVVLAQGREVQPWERGAQGLPAKSCLWKAHWRSEMLRAGRGGGAAQCWAPCSSRCPGGRRLVWRVAKRRRGSQLGAPWNSFEGQLGRLAKGPERRLGCWVEPWTQA